MNTANQPTDEVLLAALAARLNERRDALRQSAQMLTEMRAVNVKLENAERLKGRFLSNIRNEINNPLTTLRGFSAAIANTPALPPEQVLEMAASMYREVSDLSFQMQNIFAAADLEAGSSDPDVARVHVNGVLSDVVNDLKVIADYKNVAVSVEVADGVTAMTDAGKLALILSNLLRNAIEFARANVTVRLALVEDRLILEVQDDGPGITAGESKRIFDRFVQLSEGSTKSHPGHGLGLSVAQACAELIGGAIEAIIVPGAGAHFRAQFPVGQMEVGGEEADGANEFIFEGMETF